MLLKYFVAFIFLLRHICTIWFNSQPFYLPLILTHSFCDVLSSIKFPFKISLPLLSSLGDTRELLTAWQLALIKAAKLLNSATNRTQSLISVLFSIKLHQIQVEYYSLGDEKKKKTEKVSKLFPSCQNIQRCIGSNFTRAKFSFEFTLESFLPSVLHRHLKWCRFKNKK